jgi:hypothetical protein
LFFHARVSGAFAVGGCAGGQWAGVKKRRTNFSKVVSVGNQQWNKSAEVELYNNIPDNSL